MTGDAAFLLMEERGIFSGFKPKSRPGAKVATVGRLFWRCSADFGGDEEDEDRHKHE
jgi:hypothetical protein